MYQACCTTAQTLTCYNTDLVSLVKGVSLRRTIAHTFTSSERLPLDSTTSTKQDVQGFRKAQRATTAQESKTHPMVVIMQNGELEPQILSIDLLSMR